MKQPLYDVIIVGTGVSGLFTALSLPSDCRILMLTKDKKDRSDSYLAQGGISALRDAADYDAYFADTMKAGRYENNPQAVDAMIRASAGIIDRLVGYGVAFDRTPSGAIAYTREGGHSAFRILHHQDVTGKEIVCRLLDRVLERPNITIAEDTAMLDLIRIDGHCRGIVAADAQGMVSLRTAHHVVLATGGIGGLFQSSTNYPHITGDSFALALRHNIALENLHYIQIHPTVLYSKKAGRRFLISESVRGEGATLLNERHERFVDELLPRDVVTAAIYEEMRKCNTDHVYLSFHGISRAEILNHFPNIYARCLEEGYDPTCDLVPVTPAQHYLMGGIQTDTHGRTSLPHLYAVGETACNGVHGANRLASNSLLESLVFAEYAARDILETPFSTETAPVAVDLTPYANLAAWHAQNRLLLLQEIKRKDELFYAKWCHAAGQH